MSEQLTVRGLRCALCQRPVAEPIVGIPVCQRCWDDPRSNPFRSSKNKEIPIDQQLRATGAPGLFDDV